MNYSLRNVIAETWALIGRHFGLMLAVSLIVMTPADLLMNVFTKFSKTGVLNQMSLSSKLQAFVQPLAAAALLVAVHSRENSQQISWSEIFTASAKSFFKLWIVRLLGGMMIGLSFMFFIIPSIFVSALLMISETIVVLENVSSTDALRRSYDLIRPHLWSVTCFNLLLWIPCLGAVLGSITIPAAFTFLGLPTAVTENVLISTALDIPTNLVLMIGVLAQYAVWTQLFEKLPVTPEAAVVGLTPAADGPQGEIELS